MDNLAVGVTIIAGVLDAVAHARTSGGALAVVMACEADRGTCVTAVRLARAKWAF